eukprot:9702707-Prorocentrum_lima.AAC.1
MTSSLVGSEMCIRDRYKPNRSVDPGSFAGTVGRGATLQAATSEGVSRAVSYTHLTLPTICSV